LQLPACRAQAAELSAATGLLNEAVASRDAEIERLNEAEASRVAEIELLNDGLSARDNEVSSVQSERAALMWLIDERTRLNRELDSYAAQLAALQGRFDKVTRSFRWRFVEWMVHLPRSAGRLLRGAFRAREPQLIGKAGCSPSSAKTPLDRPRLESTSSEGMLQAHSPSVPLDERKATILVVSHDATRTGAPILALNLIQQFSARYNVVSLILGGGELADHFRHASAAFFVVDRTDVTDEQLDILIEDIVSRTPLLFAIANTVESRRALKPLRDCRVPTVSLVHEFSANTRPRSAFPDVISLSTETVFSTRMTLEDVVSDFWLYPGPSIHIERHGKCVVPASPGAVEEATVEKLWLTSSLRPEGASRKFLVIGVGSIDLRKGVDLFVDCATIIKDQPGGEKFQFVWIGTDPYGESAYSFFVSDQIRRAGLESQLKILRATSQIEVAYRAADLLIVSSRLDPLPNVATDALTLGLPVLCFEKTTGIADFLIEQGLGDQCVAKYLDTHDLARKVKALADSDELRAGVSRRCRAAAAKEFDMHAYVSRIEAIAMQAVGNEARVKDEVKLILTSRKFRSDFFKHAGVEELSEEKIIDDYLHRMARGLDVRKPMPGFQPTVYSFLQRSEGGEPVDPLVDFLLKGLPEGPWLQRVIQDGDERKAAATSNARVALHLHTFYPDQLPGIVERLNLNASAPDLFISVVTREGAAEAREAVSAYQGRLVDLQITPNLGRDIGPFLTQFGRVLCSSYDIVGHLHTKKSMHVKDRPFAEAWNSFLLENIVGGEHGGAMLDAILAAMELDPAIGIVFPDDPHVIGWTKNRKFAQTLAARMKCGELPEHFNFPVGSMFWIRSAALAKFVELELDWRDYAPEPLPIDGTNVHAIERLFGVVPAALGMTCAVTNVRGLTR